LKGSGQEDATLSGLVFPVLFLSGLYVLPKLSDMSAAKYRFT